MCLRSSAFTGCHPLQKLALLFRSRPCRRAKSSIKEESSHEMPSAARFLGFAGSIPFWVLSSPVAGEISGFLPETVMATTLQVAYGATIISFLGGVHWGLAMTNVGGPLGIKLMEQRYLWSVTPCLMAWPTMALPAPQAAGIQAALLGVVYMVDRSWEKRGLLPSWYMRMRLPLTVLAAAGLTGTAVGSA